MHGANLISPRTGSAQPNSEAQKLGILTIAKEWSSEMYGELLMKQLTLI